MKAALTRRQRALLLAASAISLVLTWTTLSDVLLAHEESANSAVLRVPRPENSLPVGEMIRRDPFGVKPAAAAAVPPLAPLSRVPDISALPAELDAQAETPNVATLELKATIVGGRAVAYVQDGAAIDIVHVGSTLGGRSVRSIGLRGIVFSDGTSLELSSHASASGRPAPNGRRPSTTIEDLRRLVLQALRARTAPSIPSAAALQPSAPAAASGPRVLATFPPPGALPTIVPDFLPVGVSPTADSNGATPYPLPPRRPPY